MAHRGEKPVMCVAAEFAGILDGVSYVDRLVYPGLYNDPPKALRWLKANRPRDKIIIAQSYRHPSDKRQLTASYQTESWRVAGHLEDFGKWPLVFDQRNQAREEKLVERVLAGKRPAILVATQSVSSPFPYGEILLREIAAAFPKHSVIDLGTVQAEAIYDLIALYDAAECLVSVDTLHLHLARAARCPVVAIRNDGWFGSIVPPATIIEQRYGCVLPGAVAECLQDRLKKQHRFVVHVCDTHGKGARVTKARATWLAAYGDESMIKCRLPASAFGKSAKDVGDVRDLPLLRDMLTEAMKSAPHSEDIVIWSNGDNGFAPGAFEKFKRHAALYGAFSIRRDANHIGRDVFGFTKAWLMAHIDQIPDFYMGAPAFDLVLAAIIRRTRGIVSTKYNLRLDFFPCELEPGLVTHEDHPSRWAGENEHKFPANLINMTLLREWEKANKMTLV